MNINIAATGFTFANGSQPTFHRNSCNLICFIHRYSNPNWSTLSHQSRNKPKSKNNNKAYRLEKKANSTLIKQIRF